jgi:hypothetical protein
MDKVRTEALAVHDNCKPDLTGGSRTQATISFERCEVREKKHLVKNEEMVDIKPIPEYLCKVS